MYPEQHLPAPALRPVEVRQPAPVTPASVIPAPLVPVQPGVVPAVASIVLPDGRIVTGYAASALQPEPVAAKPAVSRKAVNVALGGIGFLAVCGGLLLLTTFITALTALITQLIILAAVIFGGWVATQAFGQRSRQVGTTVTIRKAIFKRNNFHA